MSSAPHSPTDLDTGRIQNGVSDGRLTSESPRPANRGTCGACFPSVHESVGAGDDVTAQDDLGESPNGRRGAPPSVVEIVRGESLRGAGHALFGFRLASRQHCGFAAGMLADRDWRRWAWPRPCGRAILHPLEEPSPRHLESWAVRAVPRLRKCRSGAPSDRLPVAHAGVQCHRSKRSVNWRGLAYPAGTGPVPGAGDGSQPRRPSRPAVTNAG